MDLKLVEGDLLDQDVEVIVNPWNRNLIPWWLLLPQGVSGAIKRRGGKEPFREVRRYGMIPLGGAAETGAGTLPFRAIIHVAGINLLWRSSERSVRESVRNAMRIASEKGYRSIAFPLIGAGSGGGKADRIQAWMVDTLESIPFDGAVLIVRYRSGSTAH
jgi:O-acetyl-ADP-ribose deacetylase (regulator of RNase III)